MGSSIKITSIDVYRYEWQQPNVGFDDEYNGFNLVYKPGAGITQTGHVLQIHTDAGITGEFAGGTAADYVQMMEDIHVLTVTMGGFRRRMVTNVNAVHLQITTLLGNTVLKFYVFEENPQNPL